MAREDLDAALLAAPVGVALLAALEARERSHTSRAPIDLIPDPNGIDRAIDRLDAMSFGDLVAAAVSVVDGCIGPWNGGAADLLAAAYRGAHPRARLAEALVARFADELEQPCDLDRQEWWSGAPWPERGAGRRLFTDLRWTYDRGEFSWGALRTMTSPPIGCHDELISARELFGPPVSRWLLPVTSSPRVWEIHRPSDWVDLVEAYPVVATQQGNSWEIPGVNQDLGSGRLLDVPGQHGARATNRRHLVPSWVAIAQDHDAVHLSWAGLLTAEGYVSDLPEGDTTMLRFWFSEQTSWLRDRFGEPQPLPGPVVEDPDGSIDVTVDAERRSIDRRYLTDHLGR